MATVRLTSVSCFLFIFFYMIHFESIQAKPSLENPENVGSDGKLEVKTHIISEKSDKSGNDINEGQSNPDEVVKKPGTTDNHDDPDISDIKNDIKPDTNNQADPDKPDIKPDQAQQADDTDKPDIKPDSNYQVPERAYINKPDATDNQVDSDKLAEQSYGSDNSEVNYKSVEDPDVYEEENGEQTYEGDYGNDVQVDEEYEKESETRQDENEADEFADYEEEVLYAEEIEKEQIIEEINGKETKIEEINVKETKIEEMNGKETKIEEINVKEINLNVDGIQTPFTDYATENANFLVVSGKSSSTAGPLQQDEDKIVKTEIDNDEEGDNDDDESIEGQNINKHLDVLEKVKGSNDEVPGSTTPSPLRFESTQQRLIKEMKDVPTPNRIMIYCLVAVAIVVFIYVPTLSSLNRPRIFVINGRPDVRTCKRYSITGKYRELSSIEEDFPWVEVEDCEFPENSKSKD